MQMSKFGFYFNYKNEARRALYYLMTPTLIGLALVLCAFATVDDPLTFIFVSKYLLRKYLRTNVCISISVSFAIFMRCLYMRFVALNALLRYALIVMSHNLYVFLLLPF